MPVTPAEIRKLAEVYAEAWRVRDAERQINNDTSSNTAWPNLMPPGSVAGWIVIPQNSLRHWP